MKVQIQVGPDEIPALASLLRMAGADIEVVLNSDDHAEKSSPGDRSPSAAASEVLSADVLDAFRQRCKPAACHPLTNFTAREVAERSAVSVISKTYVRLYVPGPRMLGAYAYVNYAGYVSLRLPGASADGCRFAHARNVQDGNPYQVRIVLTTPESIEEAHRLAAEAYRQVQDYEGPAVG